MLERIKHEKTVDIYGHVTCLRAQRNYMVQTEDQYIFIHDALLEAVTCGNTEVPARNLSVHIQKLMQPEPGETVTGMELEFKVSPNITLLLLIMWDLQISKLWLDSDIQTSCVNVLLVKQDMDYWYKIDTGWLHILVWHFFLPIFAEISKYEGQSQSLC